MEIRLNSLSKTYTGISGTIEAVKNISLTIPSNTIYGIIGRSGAGKSTLVRLISLLEQTDSGTIWYDDAQVDSLSKKDLIAQRRRLGMIFQNFNLFSSRNVAGNIAYPMEIAGVPKSEIKPRVEELLELVGLSDRYSAPISTLSGGQKQRVAIARALSCKPDILFCDEATSALDPETTQSILQLIADIQKKMNLTVVMITHQMEVVRDACHHVAVLDDGEVVEVGLVDDIFTKPQSDVTKGFLANLITAEPFVKKDGEKKSFVRWSDDGGEYTFRFVSEATGEPLLSLATRKFDVDFNIRAGGIQHLPSKNIGTMITDIAGTEENIKKALNWLTENGVVIEKTTQGELNG